MIRKLAIAAGLALTLALAPAASAATITLGITSQPASSTATACNNVDLTTQRTSDPSTPYQVPAGGGAITQWKIDTVGATPGSHVTFLVVRPYGGSQLTVVGETTETIPNPLPAGGVATFDLATPIVVDGGDLLGLFGPNSSATCYFNGGSTPMADTLFDSVSGPPPPPGQMLTIDDESPPGFANNEAATLDTTPPADASVSAAAEPSNASVGNLAELSSVVANAGPAPATIRFTEAVPAGLTVSSAVAGSGSCTTSGQTVSCTVGNLPAGQTAPVAIGVVPRAAGRYSTTASVAVSSPEIDPNPANNSASATLSVRASSTPHCVVPKLKRTLRASPSASSSCSAAG